MFDYLYLGPNKLEGSAMMRLNSLERIPLMYEVVNPN